jgi:hypothetical protein
MKVNTNNTVTELAAGMPIKKLKRRHLEYVSHKHERYHWDDIDYRYKNGDMLYCIIQEAVVAIQMGDLLLLGYYEHITLRSIKIPSAANFYVHKPSGKVYVLPKYDNDKYCLALLYPCTPEEAMNFIESGNDLYATYRHNYKSYVIASRKEKIDNLLRNHD